MGKIFYLMGKSSTGKDTLFSKLIQQKKHPLKNIVPYTTRPIRAGEQEGVEYHFTDEEGYQRFQETGKVIEERAYNTFHGMWRYFTVDEGQIDYQHHDYVMIGTLEAYLKMKEYFGEQVLVPLLIELDDGERLQRALDRERQQEVPKYEEMCRRFLADKEDFSPEKIAQAGITRTFVNNRWQDCLEEILAYIEVEG